MKKLYVTLLVLICSLTLNAQSYLGYYHDNYAGVQSVLFNPASIADSNFRADINLFSASLTGTNDYYGVNVFDLLKSGYNLETEAKLFESNSNNFILNADILGPSFMFNIKPKHALGVFTRARSVINIYDINGEVFNQYADGFNASQDFNLTAGNFNMTGNSWGELGVSYAGVLMSKGKHFLKGGLSLKYLQGIANVYTKGTNVSVNYDYNAVVPLSSTIATTGTLVYGGKSDFTDSFTNLDFDSKSNGIGGDLGFVYEYRPEFKNFTANDYKLRFGLSVTDIGSITYEEDRQKTYDLNQTVTEAQYENANSFGEFLDANYTVLENKASRKVVLPTALHANFDWNFYRKFYLNVNGDINMTNKNAMNSSAIANTVAVTPRYETKFFSFYLPLNYMDYRGFQAGAGFRVGPLFIGSGSVITNLISDESKGFDIHAGLKIPIYKGAGRIEKPKDTPTVPAKIVDKDSDKDGLMDSVDKCPAEKGPRENNGCPWGDTDNDGVMDNFDKCPTVAGEKDNEGCPYKDTDSDGVFDKDDRCPTVKGTATNFGCPEIGEDVVKKLNDYAKTILFDVNKTTFQQRTYPVLQAMVVILKEYPGAKFSIEGHTDSDGAAQANLSLSEGRAAAVMGYLVEKGIDASRLTSKGFGETKPIATNKTKTGKALNRRVEVKLVR
ncbi:MULTISPECIES: DUF5723 family protein [unclassified Flavobacterium]|uniref:DUF5723 family protein n=1 Tax=unclassified Flavobacterium TaxID=196869 RepID=UPI00361A8702